MQDEPSNDHLGGFSKHNVENKQEIHADKDEETPIDESEKFPMSHKYEAKKHQASAEKDTFQRPRLNNEAHDALINGTGYREHENHDHAAGAKDKLCADGNVQAESKSGSFSKWLSLTLSLIALLASFAVLLYVIVVLATQLIPDHDKHVMMSSGNHNSFHEVCLDCQRLVKNPYTQIRDDPVVEGLTQRKESNVLKCCAENLVQVSAMLKAVARRQDTIKDVFSAAFADMRKSSVVSVHKQMVSETWDSVAGNSVVKFDPSNNQGLGEQSRGAMILEDGIVILKTGTYYIYSNVFFKVNDTVKASSNQTWSSHVHRTSPQWDTRTGILLTSVHTRCHNCTRDSITNFTGGIFQMQSGESIQVFLSDSCLVSFKGMSSYIGLIMLSK